MQHIKILMKENTFEPIFGTCTGSLLLIDNVMQKIKNTIPVMNPRANL
jgi:glutamine amidotransferase PdxT